MLASSTSAIYDQYVYIFRLFPFWFSFINLIMDDRRAKTIINMSIFIATLEICNCFSRKKIGIPCSLINSRLNIWVKPVFLYIALNMCFFLFICISNLFFFCISGRKLLVDKDIAWLEFWPSFLIWFNISNASEWFLITFPLVSLFLSAMSLTFLRFCKSLIFCVFFSFWNSFYSSFVTGAK